MEKTAEDKVLDLLFTKMGPSRTADFIDMITRHFQSTLAQCMVEERVGIDHAVEMILDYSGGLPLMEHFGETPERREMGMALVHRCVRNAANEIRRQIALAQKLADLDNIDREN